MNYEFEIKIKNIDEETEEDFTADNHDEAIGMLAAHYSKMLKEMELKAKDMQDEWHDEEIINELK